MLPGWAQLGVCIGITPSAGVSVGLCTSHLTWQLLSAWTNPSPLFPDHILLASWPQEANERKHYIQYLFFRMLWELGILHKLRIYIQNSSCSREAFAQISGLVGKEPSRHQLDILGPGRPAVLWAGEGAWSSLGSPVNGRPWCAKLSGRWLEQCQKRRDWGSFLFSALRRWRGCYYIAVCGYVLEGGCREGKRCRNKFPHTASPNLPRWDLYLGVTAFTADFWYHG